MSVSIGSPWSPITGHRGDQVLRLRKVWNGFLGYEVKL